VGGFRGGDGGFLTGGGAPPVGSIALYFRLRWFVSRNLSASLQPNFRSLQTFL
jgi:hypothetical protein